MSMPGREETPRMSAKGAPTRRNRKATRALLAKGALLTLSAIAVIYCASQLAASWPTLTSQLKKSNLSLALVSVVLSAVSMWLFARLWRQSLLLLGERRSMREVGPWFFAGELGKYVPGGIWGVAGRSEIAHLSGVSRKVAYTGSTISIGFMILGGAATCAFLLPWALPLDDGAVRALALGVTVLLAVVLLHPTVTHPLLAAVRRLSRGSVDLGTPSWSDALLIASAAVAPWVLAAASAVTLRHALGFPGNDMLVANAMVAAWVLGVLAVPVPAGAGIREAGFVLLSGMDPGQAVALAVLARALLIVIDASGAVVSLPLLRKARTAQDRGPHD